eukprot:CAMPEP_0180086124 /NCGR_PEP_ID=MMETSP0985-20121206/20875_1 /TAXON_ID=483367 /ORGANISM="non described non described, Strain CCMP 2436" /LENGTH=144 /DNA_ID=CAMNT_0022020127 /DNA_START=214 /DNA_END=649 /DNA_ORIENTATION=-
MTTTSLNAYLILVVIGQVKLKTKNIIASYNSSSISIACIHSSTVGSQPLKHGLKLLGNLVQRNVPIGIPRRDFFLQHRLASSLDREHAIRAAVSTRPLEHRHCRQTPPHISTDKWPPAAAAKQVLSSHAAPFARAQVKTSIWPP